MDSFDIEFNRCLLPFQMTKETKSDLSDKELSDMHLKIDKQMSDSIIYDLFGL